MPRSAAFSTEAMVKVRSPNGARPTCRSDWIDHWVSLAMPSPPGALSLTTRSAMAGPAAGVACRSAELALSPALLLAEITKK